MSLVDSRQHGTSKRRKRWILWSFQGDCAIRLDDNGKHMNVVYLKVLADFRLEA